MKKRLVSLLLVLGVCAGCASQPTDPGDDPFGRADELEIPFQTEMILFEPAPLLEEPVTVTRELVYEDLHCALYQTDRDPEHSYLSMTLAGKNYDMGILGYGGTNFDQFDTYILQKTALSAEETVYELIRNESFDVTETTYFVIRDEVPLLLYSMPGVGTQQDVDGDGQLETIANAGLSTWPNEWLHEWDLEAGEIHTADLSQMLSCDTVVYEEDEGCFIAGTQTDREWVKTHYQDLGTALKQTDE